MNIGRAAAIFSQIWDDRFTVSEKWEAIRIVTGFETWNGIRKDDFMEVVRWMLTQKDGNEA